MRHLCAVLGAALATGVAAPALAVPGALAEHTPTASTAPPKPHPGAYVGHTSQGLQISLRVAGPRLQLATAKFAFRVLCADHRSLQFTVAPILAQEPWPLNAPGGRGFTRAFHDTTGERYWIRGRFTSSVATGTLSTTWNSPHDGVCRSGRLSWSASLNR